VNSIQADKHTPATQLPSPSHPAPTQPAPTQDPTQSASTAPAPNGGVPKGTPLPAGFAASDVQFRDAQHGYAIGNVPCAARPRYCATLARTDDGGVSWVAIPTPDGIVPVDDQGETNFGGSCGTNGGIAGPCVSQVLFADPLDGYLWSHNFFFSTSDGGATWHGGMTGVAGLVVADGYVIRGRLLSECSSGCRSRIERARPGSTSWQDVNPRSAPVVGTRFDVGRGVLFVGTYRDFLNSSAVDTYRSSDAGSSWQKLPDAVGCASGGAVGWVGLDGSFADECVYPSAPTVQVLAPQATRFGPTHAIVPSAFTGKSDTWPTVTLLPLSSRELLAFLQPRSNTATAKPSTLYRSLDGGASWTRVGQVEPWTPIDASNGYRLAAPQPTSTTNPIGLMQDIQITTDGGQSFVTYGF
jgi:hypothetical protein